MHQMLNSLLIQSLDNLNCHADGAFYIFDSTEIIVAVYITAWNAKYQGWYGFSCKADLACVGAAASSYCVIPMVSPSSCAYSKNAGLVI